ncbi:MAG: hypothetical protein ABI346_07130 [Candidatus Baltobacteraceae bacterium]
MTIGLGLLLGLLAGAPASYVVVDENRAPVIGARVVFHDARGVDDAEVSGGYLTERVDVRAGDQRIVLQRVLPSSAA